MAAPFFQQCFPKSAQELIDNFTRNPPSQNLDKDLHKSARSYTSKTKYVQKYNGNYLGLLELFSQFDPFLAEHIRRYGNKGRGQVSYFSSTICEEFVKLLSDRVKAKIIADIKKAKYYSISIDSTLDIAHIGSTEHRHAIRSD